MMKNMFVLIDGKWYRGEFRWASEKGPWTFFRIGGRLRAVPNENIRKESKLSALI